MSKNTNLSFLTDYITADITNGRIGINTPSPTVAFDVTGVAKFSSDVSANKLITASSGTTGTIDFGNGIYKGIMDYSAGTGLWKLNNQSGGAGLTVYYQFQGDGTPLVSILKNGNVGIGTTTVSSLLTLSQSAFNKTTLGDARVIRLENSDPTVQLNSRQEIGFGYSTAYQPVVIGHQITNNTDFTNGSFYIAVRSGVGNTAPVQALTVVAGGNVGIGESNPTSYKLQVGGTVFANSFLSSFGYSYPTVNVWTTFYTMASERGIYSVMIGLASESFAEWQSYGVVFCQGSTGVFSTLYNSSLIQMRLSGLNIQVILTPGAGFTRELTFKVLRT